MAEPLFSVVIPTYNRSDRIRPVLESVRSQDFSDFECLVIDDGSRDGEQLEAIVAALEDERFIYVRKENGGACSARNVGFDRARGRYVALLDSDDSYLPHKLKRCAAEAADRVGDFLIYSKFIVDRGIDKFWIKPPRGAEPAERIDEYLMCKPGSIQSSTMVLPADLARRVRFDESLPSSQDTDFAVRVWNAGAKMLFVEEPLVVFNDVTDLTRVSKGTDYKPQIAWIERMRSEHAVSERAYWAYRGWQCARLASYSNRFYGLKLYLASAIRGVYPLRQAAVIAAQVLLPRGRYQAIANKVVTYFGKYLIRNDAEQGDMSIKEIGGRTA
jgi:glycosyltransferase involved in cell wall biosynthesis